MIRDVTRADFAAILRLNLESERFLSPLSPQRLEQLNAMAAFHRVVSVEDEVVAFLLAFREGAGYDSPNYEWFAARYPSFLYIDRVVVAGSHQGQRLGAELYSNLFQFARESGFKSVTCEFDTVPPNEVSRRFHERFGFREVGEQWVSYAGGSQKKVSMQEALVK